MPKDERIQAAVERHATSDMADVRNASQPRIAEINTTSPAPSTSSVLWAAWRQGLKDLQDAVLGAWGGTHEEPGSIANPLPREVYEDRHEESPPQQTDSYEHGLSMAAARGRDDRGLTR